MRPVLPALLPLALLGLSPAEAREVTDHAGFRVQIPDHPERIVSLHDWVVTVMAAELGLPLVGTTARLQSDGDFYIRSAEELFGTTTETVPLASVHGQPDPERIAGLKPDLIIGNAGDNLAVRDQLAAIAPTVLIDPEAGLPPLALYADVADWLGAGERFAAMLAKFRADLAGAVLSGCSYLPMLVNAEDGSLTLARRYGGVTVALETLGARIDAAAEAMVPGGHSTARVSPEIAGSLSPDILVLTYLESGGDTAETPRAALDAVVPGFSAWLAQNGTTIVSLPREHVYPTSFKGARKVAGDVMAAHPACAG